MKYKLWMFKPSQIRETIKMRIFGLCAVVGCPDKVSCKHTKYCSVHNPHHYYVDHYNCELT